MATCADGVLGNQEINCNAGHVLNRAINLTVAVAVSHLMSRQPRRRRQKTGLIGGGEARLAEAGIMAAGK